MGSEDRRPDGSPELERDARDAYLRFVVYEGRICWFDVRTCERLGITAGTEITINQYLGLCET